MPHNIRLDILMKHSKFVVGFVSKVLHTEQHTCNYRSIKYHKLFEYFSLLFSYGYGRGI